MPARIARDAWRCARVAQILRVADASFARGRVAPRAYLPLVRAIVQGFLLLVVVLGIVVPPRVDRTDRPVPAHPENATACARRAEHEVPMADGDAARLCRGAPDPDAPVDCFIEARTELLGDADGIALCRCASSVHPVVCYADLRRGALESTAEMVRACAASTASALDADCRPSR